MRYRRLVGETNEPAMGRGQADFLTDIDAVGQAIMTRLRLFLGEWWEDTLLGLPLFQSMLGVSGTKKGVLDRLIQEKISTTEGVVRLSNMSSRFNSETRAYDFYIVVDTRYGQLVLSNVQGEIQR